VRNAGGFELSHRRGRMRLSTSSISAMAVP
jgi:hypothetical protein